MLFGESRARPGVPVEPLLAGAARQGTDNLTWRMLKVALHESCFFLLPGYAPSGM